MKKQIISGITISLFSAILATSAFAEIDVDAAKSLAKKSDCFKCHAVNKTKKGPAYNKVALKYKDDPNAEAALIKNITTAPIVKMADGTEEEHKIVEIKDQAAIKNLVAWILSL